MFDVFEYGLENMADLYTAVWDNAKNADGFCTVH